MFDSTIAAMLLIMALPTNKKRDLGKWFLFVWKMVIVITNKQQPLKTIREDTQHM